MEGKVFVKVPKDGTAMIFSELRDDVNQRRLLLSSSGEGVVLKRFNCETGNYEIIYQEGD